MVAQVAYAQLGLLLSLAHQIRHEPVLTVDWLQKSLLEGYLALLHGCLIPLELGEHFSPDEFEVLREV